MREQFVFEIFLTMHNSEHHVSFADDIGNVQVAGMCTAVNDTVHIQVEVIEFRQKCRIRYDLIDLCVSFTNPSIKLSGKHMREL